VPSRSCRRAISSPAHDVGLFPAFVNEQHPTIVGQQTSSDCQNCSNRLIGTCESHAEKKTTSNRVPREHVGNRKADIRRPHPITSEAVAMSAR
jgi:hypothetical protein